MIKNEGEQSVLVLDKRKLWKCKLWKIPSNSPGEGCKNALNFEIICVDLALSHDTILNFTQKQEKLKPTKLTWEWTNLWLVLFETCLWQISQKPALVAPFPWDPNLGQSKIAIIYLKIIGRYQTKKDLIIHFMNSWILNRQIRL